MMRPFLIFLICLLPAALSGQGGTVTATADRQEILIGEPFKLTLEANRKAAKNLKWFRIDTIPHFEILSVSPVDSQAAEGRTLMRQTLTLTSWDSGRWNVPALTLSGLKTKPVPVTVNFTNPFDPNKPYHEVKDIVEVPREEPAKWYWYLIGAALLLLLFLLFFPKGKKKAAEEVPAVPADLYAEARMRLEALQTRQGMDPKAYYTELIDIFRTYLERRKGIRSGSRTTEDLAAQMVALRLPKEVYDPLVETLQLSDMVKFARYEPAGGEKLASLEVIGRSIGHIEKNTTLTRKPE